METSMLIVLLSLLTLLFQRSHSNTIVVDGVAAEWRNPSVQIGDSVIFKYEKHYNLYIFHNRRALNLCNLTQATLLNKPNSTTFTWHPKHSGFFYFSFNNGSLKACKDGEKLAVRVSLTLTKIWALAPEHSPLLSPELSPLLSPELSPVAAPEPTSGGVVPSTPAYHWPFRSHHVSSPSPSPSGSSPAKIPSMLPDTAGGIPFINSNPAVPLPTGEVDSATIRPLPTSGHGGKVMGLLAVQIRLCCMVWLLL